MPTILDPGNTGSSYNVNPNDDLGYTYPNKVDLRPGSQVHKKLLEKLLLKVKESSEEMSKRYPSWRKIDKSLTAYVTADDYEKKVQEVDDRKPVSIVIPYTYAALETVLTYFVAAFLEMPIFKYEAGNPQAVVGAFLMQKVIESQCNTFKVGLNLHTLFRDNFAYGVGGTAITWKKKYGYKSVMQPQGFFSGLFSKFISTSGPMRIQEETVLAEGGALKNIDPYLLLLDPNVPVHEAQEGDFIGWIEETNRMTLLNDERYEPESYFNAKYLGDFKGNIYKSQYNKARTESGRGERATNNSDLNNTTGQPVDRIWLYCTIIPDEWGLSDSQYPEKWLFGILGDKIICSARPMGLNHDQYPIALCATDFDGYSATPISRLEIVGGMQTHLDWLFSSHMTNVRKAINDMLIVDPSLINMNDLKDPQAGKLIRMRRSAWGRGVENAVKQLNVQDITARHIQDSSYLVDLIQRVTGATDALSGMQRTSGERVTAEETQYVRGSALSRLTKAAKIASLQAMQDIGYQFAMNTQQLMEKDTWVRVVGDWEQLMASEYGLSSPSGYEIQTGRMRVTPEQLMVDIDINVKDGSVVSSDSPQLWNTLFQTVVNQPLLFQSLDVIRIFKHTARIMGAKDINEFVLKAGAIPQVTPMDQGVIEQQAQQGNLVPIQGGKSGGY